METHTLDASQQPLGRLATKAATLLRGKHRPDFTPYAPPAVRVTVTHSDGVVLTGEKWRKKIYYRHSGYLGHLKEARAEEVRRRDSRLIVRRAVWGMLPKNRLRKQLIKGLMVHRGEAPG